MPQLSDSETKEKLSYEDFKKQVLNDYLLANISRNLSIAGRNEVLTGKAKFGIFEDGLEIAQIAMAKVFQRGDWLSGYFGDQTFMLAAGFFSEKEFFAQLYEQTNKMLCAGNTNMSLNNYFFTPNVNPDGSWRNIAESKNSSANISSHVGQMSKLLGLAMASNHYRKNPELQSFTQFSNNGNELAFGTIGHTCISEVNFRETINTAVALKVPMVVCVWDDGYGVSASEKFQKVKLSISEALHGFEMNENGLLIYKTKGWDYPHLIKTFLDAVARARNEHVPVLIHVEEIANPQGHSTVVSNEKHKSDARLAWERDFDPIIKMKQWILSSSIATENELTEFENLAEQKVQDARKNAWESFSSTIKKERDGLVRIIDNKSCVCKREKVDKLEGIIADLKKIDYPIRKDIFSTAKKILQNICPDCSIRKQVQNDLSDWLKRNYETAHTNYHSPLFLVDKNSALNVKEVRPVFTENSPFVNGSEILKDSFDYMFQKYPLMFNFREDTDNIDGINQGMEGMRKIYNKIRISDTIIIGHGIGLALRGLRPLIEIQNFDYLLSSLQTISNDLASTNYRTGVQQKAPVIISTCVQGCEGNDHSGISLGMVINSIRGVYVCVPRNMTQAAGFYNTLFEAEDSALVIEPIKDYRLEEQRPDNIGEYRVPLGVPEILEEGTDITLVTYGSCVKVAQDAVKQLKEFNVSVELIDVQTLLPFDVNKVILESVKKTNKIVFFDEDVSGGATAFMMQKVIEEQGAFKYLVLEPRTLTGKEHSSDQVVYGDCFSNPNTENVFEIIYDMMSSYNPGKFPIIY